MMLGPSGSSLELLQRVVLPGHCKRCYPMVVGMGSRTGPGCLNSACCNCWGKCAPAWQQTSLEEFSAVSPTTAQDWLRDWQHQGLLEPARPGQRIRSWQLRQPWQARHQMASSSVSTCFTPASSASTSSQRPIASRMLARASSRLSPWEWQPGRSRQLTDQPSSVCSRRILYDTVISSVRTDRSPIGATPPATH